MKHINTAILLIMLIVISCTSKSNEMVLSTEQIKFSFDAAATHPAELANLIDTTLLIPLSEDVNNDNIVGQLDKIVLTEEYIYIADTYMKRIVVYDYQGNIVGKVGQLGEGPEEFTSVADFCVGDAGDIYVYDSKLNKMFVYAKGTFAFIKTYPVAFKATNMQQIKEGHFLFALAPYNDDEATKQKKIVVTDEKFQPISSHIDYEKNVDLNYEFVTFMRDNKEGVLYNRPIDNNVYLFDWNGNLSKKFRFDFGAFTVAEDDLKDIDKLLNSSKEYCYLPYTPVLLDNLLMGVINKTGEIMSFIYDLSSKKLQLIPMSEYSAEQINLPLGVKGDWIVSYFNQDIYPNFQESPKLSDDLKKNIQEGAFVLCLHKVKARVGKL